MAHEEKQKMGKELYVGGISYQATAQDVEKLFSVSGRVTSIHLITDPKTGQFKGCGYVRMSTEAEAKDAIASLDGALLLDRTLTVSRANPQKLAPQAPKKPRGGSGGGSGGGPAGGSGGGSGGGSTRGTGGKRSSGRAAGKPSKSSRPR